jgi:amino-acid N-acetyltransferase
MAVFTRTDGSISMEPITIRAAGPADLPAVRALLAAASLPLDGVDEAFEHGVVAVGGGGSVPGDAAPVLGAAAIEPYGSDGLLRSVVVDAGLRGTGLGRALVAAAEAAASDLGIRDLYLLTETAEDWFPRLGYVLRPRDAAPPHIASSVEFVVSCPETGVLMHRELVAGA